MRNDTLSDYLAATAVRFRRNSITYREFDARGARGLGPRSPEKDPQ